MSLKPLAYVAPFLMMVACGQMLTPIKQGPGSDAGFSDDQGGGGSGGGDGGVVAIIDMAGYNAPGSPTIVINTPLSGAEVQYDALVVSATIISPTNTLLAGGSVQLTITPPNGGVVTAPMYPTATANVYSGVVDVSNVPSGPSDFTVSAADIAGKKASANGMYIHDHGPTLTFIQPSAMTLRGTVSVEIVVDDALHPVTSLAQVQAGIKTAGDITLTQIAGAMPFRVAATVDIVNNPKYVPALDGPQIILAQATNSKGTVGKAQRQFTVDNAGPAITITQPLAGSFVGGVIEIKADIVDVSNVDDATTVAVFGGAANSVPLTRLSGNTFHGFFDVRSLGTSYVLPELSVRADDKLGNHGEVGEEIIVDNTRPWMTMNSALLVRTSKLDANGGLECSRLFSPIGAESVYERGQPYQQIVTVRTRIEDRGNTAPGLTVERFSGLEPASVTMYAVPDDGSTLAVDTDGDTYCDEVNPLLIPTTNVMMSGEALSIRMAPLATSGDKANYVAQAGPIPAGCSEVGDAQAAVPQPLCTNAGTVLTTVIPYPDLVSPIWTIPPVTGTPDGCVGFQLDSLNRLPEGPTCFITRAADKAGNVNVSFPLHICIDRGGNKCAGFSPTPAHCTGVFDKAQQKLVPGKSCFEPLDYRAVAPAKAGTFPTDNSEVIFTGH